MKRTWFVGCTLVCLSGAPRAHGWGCRGHETVAYLAEKHLTPQAKALVVQLLAEHPVDPNQYCGGASGDLMADVSTWADAQRQTDPTTAPWHYIDIPLGEKPDGAEKFCGPEGCVTRAIADQLAILEDNTAAGAQRAAALRFIIHFVGDLHQPLHASTNGDRGGNCVPVAYFALEPHETHDSYRPNLHEVWDTEIPEKDMQGLDAAAFAEKLERAYSSSFARWQQGGLQLEKWAWESHQNAADTTYGALPKKVPREPEVAVPTCAANNNIGQRMLAKNIVLDSRYQAKAAKVVERRLAQAGIRLALILNEAAKSTP